MDKKELLTDCINKGYTMKRMGQLLGGISRQRIYQLLQKYNISTPDRKKPRTWKAETPLQHWLKKMLYHKPIPKEDRKQIYDSLKDSFPVCPILGITLDFSDKKQGYGSRTDFSPSLDRINNKKGYELGNLIIISWRANRLKNDGDAEEHRKISDYLYTILLDR